MDGHYQDKVSIDRCDGDRHALVIYLGGKRNLAYLVIICLLRKFINADDLKGKQWDTNNFFDTILKVCTTRSGKCRCQSWFNSSVWNIFDSIAASTLNNKFATFIILTCKAYVKLKPCFLFICNNISLKWP